jgi:hypothetical protein
MEPDYALLERQVEALLACERDVIANAANFAAFVYGELSDLNWPGFYFTADRGDLVLGRFNSRPACTHLPYGSGAGIERLVAVFRQRRSALRGANSSASELMQYRVPRGPGPSSKTWPRCESQRAQRTSVRCMP